jgi:hypothetical protein
VKLVVTLLTRDQADIVGSVVAYHLHAGADLVIATDHRSEDGTTEILESYERDGVLRLVREQGPELRTQEWRTRMATMAAELGADWVVGCDGDEFWWPSSGSLKEVLAAVPRRFGVVEGPWRFFLPRSDGPTFFAERMTVRLTPLGALEHPRSPFRPRVKIAHRARPDLVVQGGNHKLLSGDLAVLPGWHPLEVLHFPSRTLRQHQQRHEGWVQAGRPWDFTRGAIASAADSYASQTIDDELLRRGLEAGVLAIDTRLRDVLCAIRTPSSDRDTDRRRRFLVSTPRPERTPLPPRGAPEDVVPSHTAGAAFLLDHDLLRTELRLDGLRARLSALEQRTGRGARPGGLGSAA